MAHFPFVFTVLFLLIGPIKLIPAFAQVVAASDKDYQRAVAVRAAMIATLVALLVAGTARYTLGQYRISVDALRIAGGLVLMLAALKQIFVRPEPPTSPEDPPAPLKLAASPVAAPIIVPPAGVAAILIFMALAPTNPGMGWAAVISIPIIMALNFLVMWFNLSITQRAGLMLTLQVVGSVLVFVQVALGVQTTLIGLRWLGYQG